MCVFQGTSSILWFIHWPSVSNTFIRATKYEHIWAVLCFLKIDPNNSVGNCDHHHLTEGEPRTGCPDGCFCLSPARSRSPRGWLPVAGKLHTIPPAATHLWGLWAPFGRPGSAVHRGLSYPWMNTGHKNFSAGILLPRRVSHAFIHKHKRSFLS